MGKFFYSTPDNAVLEDKTLSATDYRIYNYIKSRAGVGNVTALKVKTIADELGVSKRTVQYSLKELDEKGIVERIFRKSESNPKYNISSLFIVHGRNAPCYAQQEEPMEQPSPAWVQLIAPMHATGCTQELEPPLQEDILRTTLKGEAELPKIVGNIQAILEETHPSLEETVEVPETHEALESAKKPKTPKDKPQKPAIKAEPDLRGVPDIMIPTARYWLDRTGHTSLSDNDRNSLCILSQTQYPTYVQKQIDIAIERWHRLGRHMSNLHIAYIVKCLEGKRTYNPSEKPPSRHKRAAKRAAKAQGVQEVVSSPSVEQEAIVEAEAVEVAVPVEAEPVMPVEPLAMPEEDAKQVIAEYEAEQSAQAESDAVPEQPTIPKELAELHERMNDAFLAPFAEYMETLPKAEDGSPIFPDDDEFEDTGEYDLTLEKYLRLKFPDANEEDLHRDYSGVVHEDYSEHPEFKRLQKAFEIDNACAFCMHPEDCKLPEGCRKGKSRPDAKLYVNKAGQVCLGTAWSECLQCKHPPEKSAVEERKLAEQKRQQAEFERKVRMCGLSPMQREKTFSAYDHEAAGADGIVAKAMAILAAKNKRNLVLSGKAGTGKTHLAVAIAIEAMKADRQAIVKSVPELMDELIMANRNNTDPYGLMMKYKSVPCLVLDDLGKQTNTEAVWKYLYQLVDYRYQYGLQTIVTTNAYSMEGLMRKWNEDKVEPIITRLLENGDWVTISEAENYRTKKPSRVCEGEKVVGMSGLTEPSETPAANIPAAKAELIEPQVSVEQEDKVAVQKARWLKHSEGEEAKSKPELEAPTLTAEVQAKIDAMLDEQCDAANMSDEEIDAMVDEAFVESAPVSNSTSYEGKGIVIYVPSHDDGLDDDDELRL